ncbi:HAD-IA family hydrolase [Komagataeibacter xylinus]|uniref:HAD-IA family hydrolase n=1 Tax=Komagataeibacter xylinus TaxID=28448 RepID=UPI00102FFC30|nr:HAD-IA family hydrolase [Komagataeibacter xylinus]
MKSWPEVLTFDVVGTLIDFESGMVDFIRAHCGPAGQAMDREAFLAAYGAAHDRAGTLLFPDDMVPVYHILAEQFDLPRDDAIAEAFAQDARNWKPFPDTVAALKRLSKHFKLVAMTNCQRWAFSGLEKSLDYPFFDTVTVDDALCEKPDPEFFAFTRGRLSRDGIVKDKILHVAQSQFHDIGIAREMGYCVCWIERRQGLEGYGATIAVEEATIPDYHFATLAELADFMDEKAPVAAMA